jgi:AraC-like DNA-binding protein
VKRPPLTQGQIEAACQRQSAFFSRTGNTEPLRQLFEFLPRHRFFVKNAAGQFILVNAEFLRRRGFTQDSEVIGLDDSDVHPVTLAHTMRTDDERIMRTGQPLIRHVEMLFNKADGKLDWGCTTKLPLLNPQGQAIGVLGISYPCDAPEFMDEDSELLRKMADLIRQRHAQPLRLPDLAREAGVTSKRLNEMFTSTYGLDVPAFIIHCRIEAAASSLIATTLTVGNIALDHGFADQSAFTRHFRRAMGQTPSQFRLERNDSQRGVADFAQEI